MEGSGCRLKPCTTPTFGWKNCEKKNFKNSWT